MKILLILISILFLGCVTTTKISLLKMKGVAKHYKDGHSVLYSKKENSSVSLSVSNSKIKNGERLYFWMTFSNFSKEPADVKSKNVKVYRRSKKDSMNIITYDELIKELESNKRTYKIISGIGLFAGVLNAGRTTYSGNMNINRNGHSSYSGRASYSDSYNTGNSYPKSYKSKSDYSGSVNVNSRDSISYSGSSYNSSLAKAEIKEQVGDVQKGLADYTKAAKSLKDTILKRNTVMPNRYVSGYVVSETPELEKNKEYFLILVNFAGDTHRFTIKQTLLVK